MKPHSSDRIVRRWCIVRTNPVRGCFDNPEELNRGNLPRGCGSRVHELANSLILGTTVLSQDLSGAWVTVHR
jgi:hypothetical protein